MSDRRHSSRDDSRDRRTFPRPPLWLNLLLLLIAGATFAYARYHHNEVKQKSAVLFRATPSSPAEINKIRDELSTMDLSRAQLAKQLDSRMQYLQDLNSGQFYIAVDTGRRKLYLRLGKEVVREADVELGEARTVKAPSGISWTFVPVKGSFNVSDKQTDYPWRVPEWVYALNGDKPPAERPTVQNGLGRYVLVLQDNYVIHSPPPPDSPLAGHAKPGSIMVPEADLAAIWPRISNQTRVYIF
jgi:hypothetical protein